MSLSCVLLYYTTVYKCRKHYRDGSQIIIAWVWVNRSVNATIGSKVAQLNKSVEDIFSFARLILFGYGQEWGSGWTQVEVDGFFFNQFLNQPLQDSLREARGILFQTEDPPFPCQWNDVDANKKLIGPWGGNGDFVSDPPPPQYYTLTTPMPQGSIPSTPRPQDSLPAFSLPGDPLRNKAFAAGVKIGQEFSVHDHYVLAALFYGTLMPFRRLIITMDWEWPLGVTQETGQWNHRIPIFTVIIFAQPVQADGLRFIEKGYEGFRKGFLEYLEENGPLDALAQGDTGINISHRLLQRGPLRIAVRPPFPSGDRVIKEVNKALKSNRQTLTGSRSVQTTIRCWAVHLLIRQCGLSNRDSIRSWNAEIGDEIGYSFTMYEEDSITNPGESQFARDNRELRERIRHYVGAIPTDYSII